jgi:ribosomal protein S18 acetylase RimI-like enzyme
MEGFSSVCGGFRIQYGIMNAVRIIEVCDGPLIAVVETLAQRIWREHYIPLVGRAQVEYMLEKFQSRAAISIQINKEGFFYYLFEDREGAWVGYGAVIPRSDELFLSKLYVSAENRGRGYGRSAVEFVEKIAENKGLPKISLNVNKKNTGSIRAYEKFGFVIIRPFVTDVGGGFVMDDYRMEKLLSLS